MSRPTSFLVLTLLLSIAAPIRAEGLVFVQAIQDEPRQTDQGTLWATRFLISGRWESTCVPTLSDLTLEGDRVRIDTFWPLDAPCIFEETEFVFETQAVELLSDLYRVEVWYEGEKVHTQETPVYEIDGFLIETVPEAAVAEERFRLRLLGEWRDGCTPAFGDVVWSPERIVVRGLGRPCEAVCVSAVTEYEFETDLLGPLAEGSLQVDYEVWECDERFEVGSREIPIGSPQKVERCRSGLDVLCLDGAESGDHRFRIEVLYQTDRNGGLSGQARVLEQSTSRDLRGGLLWFFAPDNPEMLVKLLEGCAVNAHWWVFVSALTDVGYTVTVTDTATGEQWTRENPDRHLALPVSDVEAFPCSLP